jgi:hypothetical protein
MSAPYVSRTARRAARASRILAASRAAGYPIDGRPR